MRKLYLCFFIGFLITPFFAQVPERISYQSVIRNADNSILSNTQIGMLITILNGEDIVYIETHSPLSNSFGLISLEVGGGVVMSGNFSTIDWGTGEFRIKTEIDPLGGNSYTLSGTTQLLSVPYALYAKSTKIPISKVFVDNVGRQIQPSWVYGPSFENIEGFNPGSQVKISYIVPSRADAQQWCGLYIEPQISFDNGIVWYSLGSCGFDGGIMANQSGMIGSYTNTLLIDPQQTSFFNVKVRFLYKSYGCPVIINSQNDINSISGSAPLMSGINGQQHFTKVIIEEVFNKN